MNEQTKADEFRLGDRVWCVLYGSGEITSILTDHCTYPLEVIFENDADHWYTVDGKVDENAKRTLFFSEPKIEAAVTRPFVPTLVGKTVVIEHRFAGNVIGEITAESETLVRLGSNNYRKCNSIAIYEVSSENLLVDVASVKTALK